MEISPRAWRYGDGFFESMPYLAGRFPWWNLHLARIKKSLDFLGFERPNTWEIRLQTELKAVLPPPQTQAYLSVRLSFLRQGPGLYTPQSEAWDLVVETRPLAPDAFAPKNQKLKMGSCLEFRRMAQEPLSNLKTCSALPLVLASRYRQQQAWDEALLYNQFNRPVEGCAANLWVLGRDGIARTPPLSEGCLDGILRRFLLEQLPKWGQKCQEQALEEADLIEAQEIWLSNSSQGLRNVFTWETRHYAFEQGQKMAQKIYEWTK